MLLSLKSRLLFRAGQNEFNSSASILLKYVLSNFTDSITSLFCLDVNLFFLFLNKIQFTIFLC